MCGIVGATAARNITPILLEGLRRLEYRGYDSAGVAVITAGELVIRRAVGKVQALADSLEADPITAFAGIAHTRWATHGKPSEANAHPHRSGQSLAVVHNGIIENHEPLRRELQAAGFEFQSETDTEVLAHLIAHEAAGKERFIDAFGAAIRRLEGAYGLAAITPDDPEALYLARMGSPLVIGISSEENYVASDPLALLQVTDRFIHLENRELARVDRAGARLYTLDGQPFERGAERFAHEDQAISKGSYRHFMLKEIHEQPEAVANTLADKIGAHGLLSESLGPEANAILPSIRHIHIIACGTSFHAGLVARYWIEALAGIPVNVEVASEYRYRQPAVPPDTLFIGISQSGETADTLSALRFAQENNYLQTLAISNMPGSALVRESGLRLLTQAGVEIGVASTKAFTTQLAALYWLALTLARARGRLDADSEVQAVAELRRLPQVMKGVLELEDQVRLIAELLVDKVEQALDFVLAAEVAGENGRAFGMLRGGRDIGGSHVRAPMQHARGGFAAHAAGAPGDENPFIGE